MYLRVVSFLIVSMFICFHIRAQTNILSQFSGFQKGSSIQLSFTINGGNTCLGTDIQRSPDSIHFESIGSISGICGSTDKDETYSFEDKSPLINQPNYYRLILGQLGFSEFITVTYIDYQQGIVIFPNPFSVSSAIYFPNEKKEEFEIKIFDVNGILLSSFLTREAAIYLNAKNFSRGIYLVTVEKQGTILYQNKIAVQ